MGVVKGSRKCRLGSQPRKSWILFSALLKGHHLHAERAVAVCSPGVDAVFADGDFTARQRCIWDSPLLVCSLEIILPSGPCVSAEGFLDSEAGLGPPAFALGFQPALSLTDFELSSSLFLHLQGGRNALRSALTLPSPRSAPLAHYLPLRAGMAALASALPTPFAFLSLPGLLGPCPDLVLTCPTSGQTCCSPPVGEGRQSHRREQVRRVLCGSLGPISCRWVGSTISSLLWSPSPAEMQLETSSLVSVIHGQRCSVGVWFVPCLLSPPLCTASGTAV